MKVVRRKPEAQEAGRKMKAGANTRFIRWCMLGAIGAVLMAAFSIIS